MSNLPDTNKYRVLVFPASTEIAFEIAAGLQFEKSISLFGAGQNQLTHAPFVFNRLFPLPHISDPSWLPHLIDLCKREGIDFILPAHDDAIVALADNQHDIPARVLAPTADLCRIARSKTLTYMALRHAVRTPTVYDADENFPYPVFVKPDRGQGSLNAQVARNKTDLDVALRKADQPIICEYLPGEEFTVDCFSDRTKGVMFAGARQRQRIRNGIAVNTVCVDLPEARQIAEKIYNILPFIGAWFFQLKRNSDGELTVLETAPRIAGSMAAHRVRGINFPLLTIYESLRMPLEISYLDCSVELDRALCNRYHHNIRFNSVYVDLDDTIVLGETLNSYLIGFLYRCISENKRIVLLTRHKFELNIILSKYRISQIFDEIIHIQSGNKKSEFIDSRDAIFIDDSFSERSEVHSKLGIPCFDVSMLEVLVNAPPPYAGEVR